MRAGVLLRHYKNYGNVHFIPVCDQNEYMYSVYVGNNGAGKSAVLEAIDAIMNNHGWNVTFTMKKTEAFICPVFLIEKKKVKKDKVVFEAISDFYWNADENINSNIKGNVELCKFLDFKNKLREAYKESCYFIMIGSEYENVREAYCSTFHSALKKSLATQLAKSEEEAQELLNGIKQTILDMYNYLYIPVEESPNELLKLQNTTMQQLLNKNILSEIEKILNKKNNGSSIVSQINSNLDEFIEEVNNVIAKIDKKYSFTSDSSNSNKKNLTARDIREKILEAYFPLRALKANGHKISQLSSGEQRKAIIDVAYSILVANGKEENEKEIIFAIDEPETSMHISNCFKQFTMLEELARLQKKQIILTTHWYGFLPIAQNGNLHHITLVEDYIQIDTFSLYNILEERRAFPDVIELKSMYDLATSIITFMRTQNNVAWIICEGSDDKIYLETMLKDYDVTILPVGGCGNVVKLFQLLYSPLSEKKEGKGAKALFLIDTDRLYKEVKKPLEFSHSNDNLIILRRLQISEGKVILFDPCIPNVYEQTEMEDCLEPKTYYLALQDCISKSKNNQLKGIFKKYAFVEESPTSVLRGDKSCIIAQDPKVISSKQKILDFAEESENKYSIAKSYKEICEKSGEKVEHDLEKEIVRVLELSNK